ncbi:cytochrome P450 [Amycolatopsis echigonensis]
MPECWTDPDTFDPDRFAPHRRENHSHRFAWVPFGGGVHKCIGMCPASRIWLSFLG